MPRYVVLEHRWNGVHWDFMLEIEPGEGLRTWAIDEEIVAGRDLSARALPDHRAAYLDHEGKVSGGRGTVRRFDRGEFTVVEWSNELVKVDLRGDQLDGLVELRRAVAGTGGGASALWVFRLGNRD